MQPKDKQSLRLKLIDRLLPATLVLLLVGAMAAYWIALRTATKAYDRSLLDTAFAISQQIHLDDGLPHLDLTPQARTILLTDKFDRIFFSVRDSEGRLLDGNPELPLPSRGEWGSVGSDLRIYYDGITQSVPVRLAALKKRVGKETFTIIAAETLTKRTELVRDILFGMLLPETLLAIVSASVVWFGVRSGLRPLDTLRQELADRSHADLRPVNVDVPEEIQPVVSEINKLLARLEHSLAKQRNFVSDAAHQLRTPIAALQAQVEAARQEIGPPAEKSLRGVLTATQRLSHLLSQMLVLARAEPGLEQAQPVIHVEQMAAKLAEIWLPEAIKRQIDLGFELNDAEVKGNIVLLEELLSNLINNALHHTPAQGVVTVACGQDNDQVWITVDDSGPGIPQNERERVFERFFRINPANNNGNGLGLAIVQEIARQHGGSVAVQTSERLGGACLRVTLPSKKNSKSINPS